jgi:hypothetical protein
MRILNDVEEIFAEYDLKPIVLPDGFSNIYQYLNANPGEASNYVPEKCTDGYLLEKYRDYIPHGWYGFDVGTPIIPEWMEILDGIVELCTMIDPAFEIHQIKLKFGGIRFYVYSEVIEDTHEVELLIGDKMFDPALIY